MGTLKWTCPICGNSKPSSLGLRGGNIYCRKCLSFIGKEATYKKLIPYSPIAFLKYELSNEQKRLSKILVNNYINGQNSFVYAVCGAGKTEIVIEVIKYALAHGHKVGFAVPRKDVVLELSLRFREIFVKNSVVSVYGGHTQKITGDLVCLTTHQLFHYNHYFDLLIMDEIDAFPYSGNATLHSFFVRAIRGNYVLMSATPSSSFLQFFRSEGGDVLELFQRFHRYPLPVPAVIVRRTKLLFIELVKLLKRFKNLDKQVFVFTPTIEMCESIYKALSLIIPNGNCVHSKSEKRKEIIEDFKNRKFSYLVTTAVLERGITVKDIQVIIYRSDHSIYDSAALIQIAGRVGRKIDAPEGEVYFLAHENNQEMQKAITEIERINKNLQSLF